MASTLEEKNLLLKEQILFFKSWPHLEGKAKMKMPELFPLKVTIHLLKYHTKGLPPLHELESR